MQYVIGVDGGSTKSLMKAKDMEGNLLAESRFKTANHHLVGTVEAQKRIYQQITELTASFKGEKEDCACIVVGAAGIDSPNDKIIVDGFYNSLLFGCPVFCMNDGSVALYATTKGVGVLSISGTGSIAVGRNAKGRVTRSGGYPSTIFGNEGSSQWIAFWALNYASKWVDGSVESSPLIEKFHTYFKGLDSNKLTECAVALRRRLVDTKLPVLVYEAAKEGDAAALSILKNAAAALSEVTESCVRKLDWTREDEFLCGVWGSVFVKNEFFYRYYKEDFLSRYPNSKVTFPEGDAADGAVSLALDYIAGKADMITTL
jgi:N-acetylglucosamine kinase-like BadF-type ATPase